MARSIGFDRLPNGNYFNEWFGEVTAEEMRMIRSKKMSQLDFTLWQMEQREGKEIEYDIFGKPV